MVDKKNDRYPSTFTIDNFSSTTTLTPNEIKVPIGSKDSIDEKQYDPYEHRSLEHANTFSGALIHILKSSLGTGILAVPLAFMHAGLLVGFIGTLLLGLICTHSIHMLVVASLKMCRLAKVPSMGFAETAQAVFKYGPKPLRPWSNFSRLFVDIALILTYFCGDAVYIVFISDSINQILAHYCPTFHIDGKLIMLIIMLFLMPCCQIRPLKYLVPLSAVANFTMLVAFGITFYYMIDKTVEHKIHHSSLAKGFEGLPKFLVTIIFAMEGIGTILPVENSMKKPKFIGCPGVLNISMTMVVFLYASMGSFGYYVFGDRTCDSITYNLPEYDLAMIGRGCISTAVFFTFMLQFYVPMEISWRHMHDHIPLKHHNKVQIIWRIIAVMFITGIAMGVPDLGTIIDLVGAIFLSTLGLTIPAILDIIVNWGSGYGKFHWKLYKNFIIIGIALIALVSGTYFSWNSLVNKSPGNTQCSNAD